MTPRRPFAVHDGGKPLGFRRAARWVVDFDDLDGLAVVYVDEASMYDPGRVVPLAEDDPWHIIGRALITVSGELGGVPAMELPWNDSDRYLAERLLDKATLRTNEGIAGTDRCRPTGIWDCYGNAVELAEQFPGSVVHVGLALHLPWWVLHSWVVTVASIPRCKCRRA